MPRRYKAHHHHKGNSSKHQHVDDARRLDAAAPAPARFSQDDFMSQAAKPLWGDRGRGDLQIISQLGANLVRTYGNNPANDHRAFLDEADTLGLQVIPGISNWPYLQMPGNCRETNYTCTSQVQEAYLGNLKNGFLLEDRSYHPALAHIVIMNEPDLNMPGVWDPVAFSRTVISAADGMLQAERIAGVVGDLVNMTSTVTFATCGNCTLMPGLLGQPAIRQMLEIRNAFMHPEAYGYEPMNDLATFYRTRFINSFNTHNFASELRGFLGIYATLFQETPVYVEEFHNPNIVGEQEQSSDLLEALSIVGSSPLMLGLSFFEYQVSYHKNDTFESGFGIFGLGDYVLSSMQFFGEPCQVQCLKESSDVNRLSAVVAKAYGGAGVDLSQLCVAQPEKVLLSEEGYQLIYAKRDVDDMSIFVQRLVEHLGGNVLYASGLQDFAMKYSDPAAAKQEAQAYPARHETKLRGRALNTTLASMVSELARRPKWASWDTYPACVADRDSDTSALGLVIHDLCMKMHWFNCSKIPKECRSTTWKQADYVLSVYQRERDASRAEPDLPPQPWTARHSPLHTCYYGGAAIYASSSYYDYGVHAQECVISGDPSVTPLTDEGYQAVLSWKDAGKSAVFVERLVRQNLHANITSHSELRQLFTPPRCPPASVAELSRLLLDATWVCGGAARMPCSEESGVAELSTNPLLWLAAMGWMWLTLSVMAGLVFVACLGSCCYGMTVTHEDSAEDWAKRNKQYLIQLHEEMCSPDTVNSGLPSRRQFAQSPRGRSPPQAAAVPLVITSPLREVNPYMQLPLQGAPVVASFVGGPPARW